MRVHTRRWHPGWQRVSAHVTDFYRIPLPYVTLVFATLSEGVIPSRAVSYGNVRLSVTWTLRSGRAEQTLVASVRGSGVTATYSASVTR